MDFKDRFHELRKAHKMTLEDVGNSLGLTKATVQKWELGSISNIKLEHIEKLSNLFDCTKAYLMGWETSKKEVTPITKLSRDDVIEKIEKVFAGRTIDKNTIDLMTRLIHEFSKEE